MEWNGKFYFEWPEWMGTVYTVSPNAVDPKAVIVLPDGVELQLTQDADGYVEVSEASTRSENGVEYFGAERVFNTKDEANPDFGGDWEPLLRLINAAAAVNTLFSVHLTQEEFERLSANQAAEFEALKEKLSPRAASLVELVDWSGDMKVDLYRTGRCP